MIEERYPRSMKPCLLSSMLSERKDWSWSQSSCRLLHIRSHNSLATSQSL